MITINATGDTTIHTANKYCPEDILVKVPAGGSLGEITVYTGNSAPTDTVGSDGDIYLVVSE